MNLQSNRQIYVTIVALVAALGLWGCQKKPEAPVKAPEVVNTPSGLEMVVIPAGSFQMGSDKGQDDETPVHTVQISSFWMDRYEVVQSQFRKFEFPDPSHFKGKGQPLEQINWTDAALYCNERSIAEGLQPCYDEDTWQCDFDADGYRLPTEAEWEYACRAGTTGAYSFGSDVQKLSDYAWFADSAAGKTHPVGQKKPNAWGLYDMHGNVAEWCNDLYAESYYAESPAENPRGPAEGTERVLRGGAWNSSADSCRSSYRSSDPSIDDTCLASDAIGFRCVRNAPADLAEENMAVAEEPNTVSKTGLVYDDIYLAHKTTPGHPESPQRLVAIMERLESSGLSDRLVHLAPTKAENKWLHTIHSPAYVEYAERSCREGRRLLDSPDAPVCPQSYDVAVMAAGGVLTAVDAVMAGKVKNVFCAVRPPGHHAIADHALGFCMFNNVAIGTRYVQQKYGLSKVLIVDWDVHHGNGTHEAFYDDPNVLYFSTHQSPFYPGTGSALETGAGEGEGLTINVPMPAGTSEAEFIKAYEERLRPKALAFSPEFVFISAGFDGHEDDILGSMKVTTNGFARLSRIVNDIANKCCNGRLVSVLEGGYNLRALGMSVEAHIRTLME